MLRPWQDMQSKVIKFLLLGLIIGLLFPVTVFGSITNNGYIRLHVIANSDEDYDQKLKLNIRDAILHELEQIGIASNRNEAIDFLKNNLTKLGPKLEEKISDAGFNYDVQIKLTQSDFPTRNYQDLVLPAGKYLALKVIIGEGQGANWWCVLFPPICHGDWVQEPGEKKFGDDGEATPVISRLSKEKRANNTFKLMWNEYKKVILEVWSFSKSP
ncbi:MAG: stage II sporulation protein R [Peptococcales bacterium]|jgi:stage II sporulation protein R